MITNDFTPTADAYTVEPTSCDLADAGDELCRDVARFGEWLGEALVDAPWPLPYIPQMKDAAGVDSMNLAQLVHVAIDTGQHDTVRARCLDAVRERFLAAYRGDVDDIARRIAREAAAEDDEPAVLDGLNREYVADQMRGMRSLARAR